MLSRIKVDDIFPCSLNKMCLYSRRFYLILKRVVQFLVAENLENLLKYLPLLFNNINVLIKRFFFTRKKAVSVQHLIHNKLQNFISSFVDHVMGRGLEFEELFLDEPRYLGFGFGNGQLLRALYGEVQLAFALGRRLARLDVRAADRYTGL